jgi:hypothetical protein
VINGLSGSIGTDISVLDEHMEVLLEGRDLAEKMGCESRSFAQRRFDIKCFVAEWESVFAAALNHQLVRNLSRANVWV